MKIENKAAYAATPFRKGFTLKVNAILDGVPGAFNQPEDLMNWICQNPYVQSVELVEVAK
jgi:hypothetical protein